MNKAIEILEDVLNSARCNLKRANRHIENNTDNRPEFYQQVADSIKVGISQLESAIVVLKNKSKKH